MTADDLKAALCSVEEACPCRSGKAQDFCHSDDGWRGLSVCICNSQLRKRKLACRWPGHAAARKLARVAAEWGAGLTMQQIEALDAILGGGE